MRLQKTWYANPSLAPGLVEFPSDRYKLRVVNGRDDRSKNLKPGVACLTAKDRQQRGPLRFGCLFIYKRLHRAVPLVKGAGPAIGHRPIESIKFYVTEIPLHDVHSSHTFATFFRIWKADRVAGTGRNAVTIFDVLTLHSPRDIRHRSSFPG